MIDKYANSIPSINTIVRGVWRLSSGICVAVICVQGGKYIWAFGFFAATVLFQVSFASNRFLWAEYPWFRRWILSILGVSVLSIGLNLASGTAWWVMLPALYSSFAYKIFSADLATLGADKHIPRELPADWGRSKSSRKGNQPQ